MTPFRHHNPIARIGAGVLLCAVTAAGLVAALLDAIGRMP